MGEQRSITEYFKPLKSDAEKEVLKQLFRATMGYEYITLKDFKAKLSPYVSIIEAMCIKLALEKCEACHLLPSAGLGLINFIIVF